MTTQNPPPNGIDISRPNVARIYDYLLGGKDNFTVDREAAKKLLAVTPDMAGIVRDNRSFIGRVVRHLADEGGIRQFLDLGGGLPTQTNVHEMAQRVAPVRGAAAVAARRCRPQGLAGELVVDPALGGGQRVTGAAPAELDQLGGYRYRGLLRRPGPEIKPDR